MINNAVKEFKDNYQIIFLIFNTIGLLSSWSYYNEFGIDILFYLSVTDLIFLSLKFIVYYLVLFIILSTLIVIVTGFLQTLIKPKNKSRKTIVNLIIYFILLILAYLSLHYYSTKYLPFFSFIFLYFYILVIVDSRKESTDKIYNVVFENKDDSEKNKKELVKVIKLSLSAIVLMFLSMINGGWDANNLKQGQTIFKSKNIEFNLGENTVSTLKNKSLLFLGETFDYIFLYDNKTKVNLVYNKGNINELRIYKSRTHDEIDRFLEKLKGKEKKEKSSLFGIK